MARAHLALLALVYITALLIAGKPAQAHETDQFTTPHGREFADLGPFFNRWAYDLIDGGVRRANAGIRKCIDEHADPAHLANAQDPNTLVNAVHDSLPWSVHQIEDLEWLFMSAQFRQHYPGRVVSFREVDHNIYENAFSVLDLRIFSRMYFASTIKVYGTYMGTDKIGHFTDLGISYYWNWRRARDQGADEREAVAAAVRIGTDGIMSEAGLLGMTSNGDYANGDLAANFAGFLFYRNLTEWTMIKGRPRPPMVVRDGAYWKINDHIRRDSDFFARFISDHLDEALNPGFFDPSMRPALRAAVRKHAAAIRWRYRAPDGSPRSREYFEDKIAELSTYWGVDYGHRGRLSELVSVANCCFEPDSDGIARMEWNRASLLLADGGAQLASHHLTPGANLDRPGASKLERPAALEEIHRQDAFHETPLHRAAARGDAKTVAQLLRDGADVRATDDFGRTPLHEAAAVGNEELVVLLLSHGADPNAADTYGSTPLHLACRNGHVSAARRLLSAGANVNATNAAGTTPLHEAAASSGHELVNLLLSWGADPTARDRHGRTPMIIARLRQNPAAVERLSDSRCILSDDSHP